MKEMLVVMNPYSGTRQANKYLAGIIDMFCGAGYDVNIVMTQRTGDGEKAALEKAEGKDIVVAIGGDGTFNEVVAGVLESGSGAAIGYIPAGTTNDFATSVGLDKSILDAAQSIISGKEMNYDIGKFNGRYFSYVASFGAFTSTSYEVPQSLKNAIGHAAYILSGIADVVNIKPLHLKVSTEGRVYEDDYVFGAICNSTSVAGVFKLPDEMVNTRDGLLEVLLIKFPKNFLEFNEILDSMVSQSFASKNIIFLKSSDIFIENPSMAELALDGERSEKYSSMHISVLNRFLHLAGSN